MSFSWKWKTFDIWYKGDDLMCYFKKGKLRYSSLNSQGSFNTLKEIDKFWDEYFDECYKISVREDKEYQFRINNDLCADLLCDVVGEHKKHEK
ncbi:MAG: hypothetical protein Q7R95_06065 [bacterium]|nr:hypothetical protein [bacterium]